MGTAAVESAMGRWLKQWGGGKAVGIYQIEPATYWWLDRHVSERYPDLYAKVITLAGRNTGLDDLTWNLGYATAFARLRYYVVPDPLPAADDLLALAGYWKRHYNTPSGRGTVEMFADAYRRFVRPSRAFAKRQPT